MNSTVTTLRASATTRPQDLAGAIAKYITVDEQNVEVVVVGAGALSQAMKGLIIAKRFVLESGLALSIIPSFRTLQIQDKEITAIVLGVDAFSY
jgi:stage V sporulation protein SpoVS